MSTASSRSMILVGFAAIALSLLLAGCGTAATPPTTTTVAPTPRAAGEVCQHGFTLEGLSVGVWDGDYRLIWEGVAYGGHSDGATWGSYVAFVDGGSDAALANKWTLFWFDAYFGSYRTVAVCEESCIPVESTQYGVWLLSVANETVWSTYEGVRKTVQIKCSSDLVEVAEPTMVAGSMKVMV